MMASFEVEVRVTPREGLLDPQGNAVAHALRSLAFGGVEGVHVGKLIRVRLAAQDEAGAREAAERMCRMLLANPVTEDYEVVVRPLIGAEA
jgi:phosphoribosylformylglycinamidine synthase PurS subunit